MQFQRLDISDPKSVEEFGKWADAELNSVNLLVNNAGKLLLWPLHIHMPAVLYLLKACC